jgi:PAS domain S-box-containing protein
MATQLLPDSAPLAGNPLVGLARTRLGYAAQLLVLGLVHYSCLRLQGLIAMPHAPLGISDGVAVAGLLLFGLRAFPAILVSTVAQWMQADQPQAVGLYFSITQSVTVLVAGALLRWSRWNDPGFERVRDVTRFVALAAVLAPLVQVIAALGLQLVVGQLLQFSPSFILLVYLRSLMGILLVTPILLTWLGARPTHPPAARWLELGALTICILATAYFSRQLTAFAFVPLFLLLCWAGLRAGSRGTTLASLGLFVVTALLTRDIATSLVAQDRLIFVAGVNLTQSVVVLLLAATVAERRRIHQQEQEVNEAYRTLVAAAPFGVIGINRSGEVTLWSSAAEQIYGWSADEVVGRPLPTVPASRQEEFAGMLANPTVMTGYETVRRRKDGTDLDISLTVWPLHDQHGRPIGAMGVHHNITERKRAAEAVRRSEERFRIVATTTNDVVYEWDIVRDLDWWSDNIRQILGYDPLEVQVGKPDAWDQLLHPDDRDRVTRALTDLLATRAEVWRCEYRLRRKDGSWAYVFDRGRVLLDAHRNSVRMLGAMMDISEQREAEEALRRSEDQLRQAMKMEAIGRLAGGVAHDFNNLLTSVLGHAGLALDTVDTRSPVHDDLLEIQAAGSRAAQLTQQLLAFSRKQMLEPRLVDLNAVVTGIARMLRRTIGEDVELATRLASDLGTVRADPVQMEQVLLNLAVNARDAMPDGGRLTIETSNVPTPEGVVVRVRVQDTGSGMTEEVRAHLFEPFYTTKDVGKGTGLGLATAYGIVQQSGGNISVISQPGQGSTFIVDLPLVRGEPVPVEPATAFVPRGGTETILLVEDEEAVRSLTRRVLELQGYHVLSAASGETALELSRSHQARIHLLLTDVVMPGISGPKLAELLVAERQGLRLIYMSGYAATMLERGIQLSPETAFLQKPFTTEQLMRRVREVLDAELAEKG